MLTRRIYASTAATANDAAHIDIMSETVITGIDITIEAQTYTGSDVVRAEVSLSSVGQHSINDAQGVIANAVFGGGLQTNGVMPCTNKFVGPTALRIPAGTRVYVHINQTGTTTTRTIINLHCASPRRR